MICPGVQREERGAIAASIITAAVQQELQGDDLMPEGWRAQLRELIARVTHMKSLVQELEHDETTDEGPEGENHRNGPEERPPPT